MDIEINWLAIIISAITSMILGATWYSKTLFGKQWMKALGLKEEVLQENQMKPMLFATVRALIMSFILFHFITFVDAFYPNNSWLENSLLTSVVAGFGFAWITIKMHGLFEGKPQKAMAINIGFEVINFILVGLVIGLIAG